MDYYIEVNNWLWVLCNIYWCSKILWFSKLSSTYIHHPVLFLGETWDKFSWGIVHAATSLLNLPFPPTMMILHD